MFNRIIYFQSSIFTRINLLGNPSFFNTFHRSVGLPIDSVFLKNGPVVSCGIIDIFVNVLFWVFKLFKKLITIFNFMCNFSMKPFLGDLSCPPFCGCDLISYILSFLNGFIICLVNFIIVLITRRAQFRSYLLKKINRIMFKRKELYLLMYSSLNPRNLPWAV